MAKNEQLANNILQIIKNYIPQLSTLANDKRTNVIETATWNNEVGLELFKQITSNYYIQGYNKNDKSTQDNLPSSNAITYL
jgi:hypothetical protein